MAALKNEMFDEEQGGNKEGSKQAPRSHSALFLGIFILAVGVIILGALLAVASSSEDDEEGSENAVVFPVDFETRDLSCGMGNLAGRFATKTVYQNRIHLEDFYPEISGAQFPTFLEESQCTLDKVYIIARHGTRYPTDGSAEEMQEFNFANDFRIIDEGLLLEVGMEEHYSLGKRFRVRYETLRNEEIIYHPRLFEANSSAKVRALRSGESFVQGMFERQDRLRPIVAIKSLDEDNDPFLRFHSSCALHEFEEDREDEGSGNAIIQSLNEKYAPILAEHFAEYGIDEDEAVAYATVLYNACPFEQAQGCVNENFNSYTGTACDLINNETIIEIMEYLADAEDYYFAGLGNQINLDQSCIMRNEIIDFLNGLSSEVEETWLRMGFGHSETLLPLIAHFNFSFYQDGNDVLTDNIFTPEADVFSEEVRGRNYRSSVLSPLANNLAFEKYSCDGDDMLAIIHNEVVVFEGTLEEFLEISNFYEEECDFDVICAVPEP